MVTEPGPTAPRRSPWWGLLLSDAMVLFLGVGYFLLAWPMAPGLASPENLANIFSNVWPLLIVAVGQTFVLISGGIDLSVTATIGLASVVGASVMTADGGPLADSPMATPAAILAMMLVGAGVGLVNGVAVGRLRMPPFIATLASMTFFGGLAVLITKSQKIYDLPEPFLMLGQGDLFGVPLALLVAGSVALAAHAALARTLFGRWLYAAGMNARAAEVSGVPVGRVTASAYVVSGLCAAVASVLYTGRLETGSPDLGQRILLDVVAAAVIGGTSLFGGRGTVGWTAAGVLFIALIDDSLNLMNLSNFEIMIVKGLVILLAALLDAARTRLSTAS